jgi:thiaminase
MALTDQDKREIEKITRKEIKDFMETTQAHKIVVKMIQDELGTKKIDDKIQKQIKELEDKQKLATEESKRLELEQNENIKKIISANNETKNFKEKGITEFENLLKKLNIQAKEPAKNKLKTESYDYPDYYFDNNYAQSPIDYEVSALPREVSPSEVIIMRQNNNEDLRGFYKNKPHIQDATVYSNYLGDFNKKLDEALKKMLPPKAYEDLNEANKAFGQGQSRDNFEKLLDPMFDYAGNRVKIDKVARMLNTPKDIKNLKALAKKEDHGTLDDLGKIGQRVYKTNARNAGRTGSGQTKTGEEVAYEAAKAAIETAITGKTPTGILPLVTRYTYGQVMGDLMVSPKFRDYMIRVSKNPKDTQAKLAMNAMIQKRTGLTTKQLSTILARDSVNKLTIDKNEESGK